MKKGKAYLKRSDIKGLISLTKDATLGVTDIVEDMMKSILFPPLLPSTSAQKLIAKVAGLSFSSVRLGTKIVNGSLQGTLKAFPHKPNNKTSFEREVFLSVLNGVLGDHIATQENPLNIFMSFRNEGIPMQLKKQKIIESMPTLNGKLLIIIHGSCANDLMWTMNGHNHGKKLAAEFGYTPLFLHYNSGLHISRNGKTLTNVLELLVKEWPVKVEDIVLLNHSMGGLVARSALYYSEKRKHTWPNKVSKVFFLGTPHQGAPLELAGSYVDLILDTIHYSKPLARLGKIRSAGITDMRYGSILRSDRKSDDRFDQDEKDIEFVPLPAGHQFYTIAATRSDTLSNRLNIGDGMVSVESALGIHKDKKRTLGFLEEHQYVIENTTHIDLLTEKVYEALRKWFKE